MLVFKENAQKPADIIQVDRHHWGWRGGRSVISFMWSCLLSAGQRHEEADYWWVHGKQQVSPRATAGQPEAVRRTLSYQTVSQTQKVILNNHVILSPPLSGRCAYANSGGNNFSPFRYCVLLLTGDEEPFASGNQEFFSFASANTKEVVRFAYVYKRLQQPLCDILMQKQDNGQSPTQVQLIFDTTVQLHSVETNQPFLLRILRKFLRGFLDTPATFICTFPIGGDLGET